MSYRRPIAATLVAALLAAIGAWGWSTTQDRFDHRKHETLFSSCDGCHSVEPTGVTIPEPALCQGCHNGQIARVVDWPGPGVRRSTTLYFNHAEVIEAKRELGEDASCASCHLTPGGGALDVRRSPPSHTPFFRDNHRVLASGAASECETCHVRDQSCVGCHLGSETLDRPDQDVALYHPADFLEQHATAAWNREVECASCHNTEVFCRSCHTGLGRASAGRTVTGYHNEDVAFQLGHGPAARQGLESCASCHAQQDCLACHSATNGRRVNPHGPDFDADKLRSKNRELCLFCHFSTILEP